MPFEIRGAQRHLPAALYNLGDELPIDEPAPQISLFQSLDKRYQALIYPV